MNEKYQPNFNDMPDLIVQREFFKSQYGGSNLVGLIPDLINFNNVSFLGIVTGKINNTFWVISESEKTNEEDIQDEYYS
jgi:hypothetical protein